MCSLKTLTSSYNLDKLNSKESILYGSLVTCKGVGSGESLKRIRRIQRLQRTPEHGRQIILRKHITFSGSQAGMPAVLYTPLATMILLAFFN